MIQKMSSLQEVKSSGFDNINVGDKILLMADYYFVQHHCRFIVGSKLELLDITRPSININMEDGIKAKTTNPPVANTETEIQIDRFV